MVALPTAAPPLADRIEHAFIANGFKSPGDRLPSERELAGMFGVSRTVVREALKTLVERKVVDVWVGRGVFIRKATPADAADPVASLLQRQGMTARQMIEARSMLEVEASRLACLRASAEELELMSQVIGRADEASTLLERVRDDLQFHLLVVRSAHNPVIETMFSAILRPTAEMMVRSISDINVSTRGLAVPQADLAGDPQQGRAGRRSCNARSPSRRRANVRA